MADGISFDIKGLAELKATLESLATKDAERCIDLALKNGAQIEQAAITAAAPVKDTTGGILPDGALKSDISIVRHRSKTTGLPYYTVQPGKYTAFVARMVEYGHRLVRGGRSRLLKNGKAIGPGKEIGEVEAKPFIRPAYEESQAAVANAIQNTLVESIIKAATKKGPS